MPRACLGFSQLSAISGPKGLDHGTLGPIPAKAIMALLQAETQNVRWRDDGTEPTATVGFLLEAGHDPTPYIGDLSRVRVVQAQAGAILNVGFYAEVG